MTTNDLKYKEDALAIHYLPAVKAMAYRLDITESRISQIHKSVIQKIKESIGA